MHDAISLYVGVFVHIKDNAISQFLLIRTKRANKIAQTFGQHRNSAIDKIHASGAFHRLFINDTTLGDIVTHVGNVHTHLPKPLVEQADRESIVEVFGVSRVDGAGKHVAKILAFVVILLRNLGRNALGRLFGRLRISVGKSILSKDGVHLGIVFARSPKHIHHLAHDIFVVGIRPLGDFHHSLIARFAPLEFAFRYKDVVHI